jgi:hypothetical protein
VRPNVTYDVRVYVGDQQFARNQIEVSIEGAAAYVIGSLAAGQFDMRLTSGAMSADDVLTIRIADVSGPLDDPFWVVNGIDIFEAAMGGPGLLGPLLGPGRAVVNKGGSSSGIVQFTEDALRDPVVLASLQTMLGTATAQLPDGRRVTGEAGLRALLQNDPVYGLQLIDAVLRTEGDGTSPRARTNDVSGWPNGAPGVLTAALVDEVFAALES